MNAVGQPIPRIDGRFKTTGSAHYTSDIRISDIVYGVIVQSTIAASSQAIGGIIWGVGQALMEQSETDPATGRFINRD